MKKEIVFKSEFEVEPGVYSLENTDAQKEIGVEEIEELPEVETIDQIEVTKIREKEHARERVAIIFIVGFFIFLSIAIVVGYFTETTKIKDITDLILAVSGVLAGPLGFIIGYYFKSKEDES